MFSIKTISAGMGEEYYRKDDYYTREDSRVGEPGQWLGKLGNELKDMDFKGNFSEAYFKLLEMAEKNRTYDLKFVVSENLTSFLNRDENFKNIFKDVVEKVATQVQRDINAAFDFRAGPGREFLVNFVKEKNSENISLVSDSTVKGEHIFKISSHSVSKKNWQSVREVINLNQDKYGDLFCREMINNFSKTGVPAGERDFGFSFEENRGRVGFDFCLSAPKSLSIAMNVSDLYREGFLNAHDRAVSDTLDFIENNLVYYRKMENGVSKILKSDNMIAAKINHFVSRDHDPQLHSHCVTFDMTKGDDGVIRTIWTDKIAENIKYIGQHYRSQLAHYMRELGFEIEVTDRAQGFWELKGISREQVEYFSNRSRDIHDYLERKNWNGADTHLMQMAKIFSRNAKESVDLDMLLDLWRADFEKLGISEHSFARSENIVFPGAVEKEEVLDLTALDLSYYSFAFSREGFSEKALKLGLDSDICQRDIDQFFEKKIIDKEFTPVCISGKTLYATKEWIALDKEISDFVFAGRGQCGAVELDVVKESLSGSGLDDEQKAAVEFICTSEDRFTAVQGYAGTGKSFFLEAAKNIFAARGYEVRGLCFQGINAVDMQANSGIASSTIHRHLLKLEYESKCNLPGSVVRDIYSQPGYNIVNNDISTKVKWDFSGLEKSERPGIWFVDEGSLIGNSLFFALQDAAVKRGAKVVILGDRCQIQAIAPGNSFARMIFSGEISFFEITKMKRQESADLKVAAYEAAVGDLQRSIDLLEKYTLEIRDKTGRFETIAEDFCSLAQSDRDNSIIITARNNDRLNINTLVRERLKSMGEIDVKEGIEVLCQNQNETWRGKLEFCRRDRVMFLKTDYNKPGVFNGVVGEVADIRGSILSIRVGESMIDIDVEKYNYLNHAYARTSFKAQGGSFKYVYLNLDTRQGISNCREKFYTDISRAIRGLTIYTNDMSALYGSFSKRQYEPSAGAREVLFNKFQKLHQPVKINIQKGDEYFMEAVSFFNSGQREKFETASEKSYSFYEKAVSKFSDYIDTRFSDPSLRCSQVNEFTGDFVPENFRESFLQLPGSDRFFEDFDFSVFSDLDLSDTSAADNAGLDLTSTGMEDFSISVPDFPGVSEFDPG